MLAVASCFATQPILSFSFSFLDVQLNVFTVYLDLLSSFFYFRVSVIYRDKKYQNSMLCDNQIRLLLWAAREV